MKQLTTCQQLRWAVYNCPTLIPSIVNNPNLNKSLSTHILHDLLPRRTSIEIECFNSLPQALGIKETNSIKHPNHINIPILKYKDMCKKYNVLDFAVDMKGPFLIDYDEHKISIKDYTQLSGLYNILRDMSIHCALNTQSGSHIHLDLTKTKQLPGYTQSSIIRFFTNKCKDGTIESIFGEAPGDDDNWSTARACGTDKLNWIYLCEYYDTLEFRCGSMTFDYSTIVKWFIGVNKLLNQYEHSIRLKTVQRMPESPKVRVVGRVNL